MNEQWKEIQKYEGRYAVSDQGNVYNLQSDTLLKPTVDPNGYRVISLRRAKKRWVHYMVSHLVLEAFIGPRPSPAHVARHINGDRADDQADNLKWGRVTQPKAMRPRGSAHPKAKLTEQDVQTIRRLHREGMSKTALGKQFAVKQQTVDNIIRGATWGWLPEESHAAQ